MREIALFVEDFAHQEVIDALIRRLAKEHDVEVRLDWRSAVRGHGQVKQELGRYLRDLRRQGSPFPDLIVAATDANCRGMHKRIEDLQGCDAPVRTILAIPDPHIERWLLLDGAAFKEALGRGCDAPDFKCDRDRYKQLLIQGIRAAGIRPTFGGIEFAEAIVREMDLERAARADSSFKRFTDELKTVLKAWRA